MPIDQRFNQHQAVALQPGGFANQRHGMPVALMPRLCPGTLVPGRAPPPRRTAQPTR